MDAIYEKTLLYDFYGELLTEHRREIYEEVVFNDMSLSEAATQYDISRQGIHDLIKKCDEALKGYENKLHMVEQFSKIKTQTDRLSADIAKVKSLTEDDRTRLNSSVEAIRTIISK